MANRTTIRVVVADDQELSSEELAQRLREARVAFEQLDFERRRRETLAWAVQVLFGSGRRT